VAERGRGISSLGQAFLGLSGGYQPAVTATGTRGRGLESFGQAFQGAGGEFGEAPPTAEDKRWSKWWYLPEEDLLRSFGYQVMRSLWDGADAWQRVTGEGVDAEVASADQNAYG
jgi:hypothetical protein